MAILSARWEPPKFGYQLPNWVRNGYVGVDLQTARENEQPGHLDRQLPTPGRRKVTPPDPAETTRDRPLRMVPDGRSSLGDAVVKVGNSAARAPLIEQLKVETRVPGEGVFAAS